MRNLERDKETRVDGTVLYSVRACVRVGAPIVQAYFLKPIFSSYSSSAVVKLCFFFVLVSVGPAEAKAGAFAASQTEPDKLCLGREVSHVCSGREAYPRSADV